MENKKHHEDCTSEHCHCSEQKEMGCSCGHCHHSHESVSKSKIITLIIGAIIFLIAFFVENSIKNYLFIASYLILGYNVIINAVQNIIKGDFFDENFLMSIATIGAIAVGNYPEAVGVMFFYQIGEFLQDCAIQKSQKAVDKIMDICPDCAYILRDEKKIKIKAEDAKPEEIMIVSPGERISLDGVVIKGESFADISHITGESVPVRVSEGSEVLSGTLNIDGVIYVKILREYKDSAAARIINIMQNSLEKKAKSEKFITSFAKKYTPAVVAAAATVAIIFPLFDGFNFTKWIYRALIFLIVSCPCALVVSVPLSFFASMGAASRKGIIIKGGTTLEHLAKTNMAIFDKTGTLTKGVFEVTEIRCIGIKAEFLQLCAYAETFSNHPIAHAIKKAYNGEILQENISDYKEIAGKGVFAKVFESEIIAGNAKLMSEYGIEIKDTDFGKTVVHMAKDGKYMGYLIVSDKIRDTDAIAKLKSIGFECAMLTGDAKETAETVGKKFGIDLIYSELLPEDKVNILENLSSKNSCIFVGDGINDAPVLATADVGIAMGGIGSDAAIEASDVILANDEIKNIPTAVKISRKTMKIVKENIVFSIGVKILVMILSIFGISNMWMAVFADVGVMLLAVLNSLRSFKDI